MGIEEGRPSEPGESARTTDPNPKLDQDRATAIKKVYVISDTMIQNGQAEQVVDLYRLPFGEEDVPLSFLQMAELVIPEQIPLGESVTISAVNRVIHLLVPQEEIEEIARRRRVAFAKKQIRDMGEEGFKDFRERGREKRSANIKAGITVMDGRSVVEGRGLTRWSEDEMVLLKALATSPDFRMITTRWGEAPNWKKIADFLNKVVHGGNNVRNPSSAVLKYSAIGMGRKSSHNTSKTETSR